MRSSFVTFATISFALVSRTASAQNGEPFYYSDDAAMTGGAAVATARDSGAIWYDPAGLGGIHRGQIDLSASAFGVRLRRVPDALRTNLPMGPRAVDLASFDIISAPHAIGLVRSLNDSVSVGFGLYITARDVRTSENQLDEIDIATGTRYRQRLDLSLDLARYHFGPALGAELAPWVRVGAAIFGTYGKANGFAQYLLAAEGNGKTEFVIAQNRIALTYFGAQATAGIQLDPHPDWTIGVVVRTPELLLSSSAKGAGIQGIGAATTGFLLENPRESYPAGTVVGAARAIAGVVRRFAARTWVTAEVDASAPFDNQGFTQRTVVDVRAGARFAVSDKLGAGVGAFTDRSRERDVGSTLGDEKVDFYGATAGLELRTPLSLSDKPAPDALVLSTTIAVKYAIGFGDARAADIDPNATGALPPRTVSVVYHEIMPYFGSGILF